MMNDDESRPLDQQPTPRARPEDGTPPEGASREQALRTLRRNHALVHDDARPSAAEEEQIAGVLDDDPGGGGDPGITRGDYSND